MSDGLLHSFHMMLDPTVNDAEQIKAPREDPPVLSTNEVRGGTRVRRS